jgi:hypothetical protein
MQFPRRQRRALVAALVLAVSVLSPGVALAQTQPGDGTSYTQQHVGSQELALTDSLAEARSDNGTLLQVWRGADNGRVWMSINNRDPFGVGATQTHLAPVVASTGNGSMVLHVGSDRRIYYTIIATSGAWTTGQWLAVPGQTTNSEMDAVRMGPGSPDVYLAYRLATCGPSNVV